jgi:predicted transcriptional regulator
MGNYRGKLDIIADILSVASRNARKTQIMYQANLSYKVLRKYLSEILGAQLVRFEDESRLFLLTEKGREFLEAYEKYSKSTKSVEKWLGEVATKKSVLQDLSANGVY